MGDFCDGEQFKEHALFKDDPTALQICLYYDDLEICNALGSKTKKHKLGTYDNCHPIIIQHTPIFYAGLFYYMLGNIDPKYRSRAECIQLLTVVRTELINKYGINEILEPFMKTIQHLEKVCK